MPEIILHQWEISPFCCKVRKILDYKKLDFGTINYNGLMANQVSRLSKAGKLPVLDYHHERIQDSTSIAHFLDTHHPDPPLYPSDPQKRALVHFWEDWADEALYWYEVYLRFMYPDALSLANDIVCAGRPRYERWIIDIAAPFIYKKQLQSQGLGRLPRQQVEDSFFVHLEYLDVILGQRPWLIGSQRTIADIAVSAQLDEILRTSSLKPNIETYGHLWAWLERN